MTSISILKARIITGMIREWKILNPTYLDSNSDLSYEIVTKRLFL